MVSKTISAFGRERLQLFQRKITSFWDQYTGLDPQINLNSVCSVTEFHTFYNRFFGKFESLKPLLISLALSS